MGKPEGCGPGERSPSFQGLWMAGLPLAAAVLLLLLKPAAPQDGARPLPRGDVAIDAAVAQSLASDRGFWTPWERGSPYRLSAEQGAFEDSGGRARTKSQTLS